MRLETDTSFLFTIACTEYHAFEQDCWMHLREFLRIHHTPPCWRVESLFILQKIPKAEKYMAVARSQYLDTLQPTTPMVYGQLLLPARERCMLDLADLAVLLELTRMIDVID